MEFCYAAMNSKPAVQMTKDYYTQAKAEDPTHPSKFLWNAKMRFGKTFATYELAKTMVLKKSWF